MSDKPDLKKDEVFLRMAVEGMTSHHPHKDGSGYQCNRNALLQDVYETCEKVLRDGPLVLQVVRWRPVMEQMAMVRHLAIEEDVPFDLLWAVWVRMNEKTGTNL